MAHKIGKEQDHNTIAEKYTKRVNFSSFFIFIALALVVGYIAGLYHFQIEAAIGPVFGYQAHSGEIDLSSLQNTYSKLAANFDGKLDTNTLVEGANKGLVAAAGDQYTVYMTAAEWKDYSNNLSGNIGGGIGAEIGIRNNRASIIRVLKDNPAEKAGLLAGDIILKVNNQDTTGWTIDKAVSQVRGDEGTTVKLTIQRGDLTKDYVVTRAIINNPSVESSVAGSIGVLTISRFDDQTGDLAKVAADNFVRSGVKSVILDLRNNGGGFVDAARDVAGLWLNSKVVVTERVGSNVKSTLTTGNNALLAGLPTIVVVNGDSASASEIVAGALQDYKVAKLVGDKTFGKGSVQEIIPLDLGAQLKVTIAKWYTPNGKNITKEGIKPNYSVTLTKDDSDKGIDPQMDKAKSLLSA